MPLSVVLSQYFALLPIIVVLFVLKKIKDWRLWVIFFYCICSFINDSILVYASTHDLDDRVFIHVFTVLEYLVFAGYLLSILINKTAQKALITLSVVFTVFCSYIIIESTLEQFDSVQSSISAIILISFCIIYLFEEINKPELTFIYASYRFWIVAAILIYFAATLFLYGFAATLPPEVMQQYWIINNISNILKSILFSIAVIVHVRTPNRPKSPPFMEQDYQPYLN
jgi:hypothetical protein